MGPSCIIELSGILDFKVNSICPKLSKWEQLKVTVVNPLCRDNGAIGQITYSRASQNTTVGLWWTNY